MLSRFYKIVKSFFKIEHNVFLVPIIISVLVSLFHVVSWWELTNPIYWAIYLSIAIEVAVLATIRNPKISNIIWIPFTLVTLIQVVGNIFAHYQYINIESELFISWLELVNPILEYLELNDSMNVGWHKRFLAISSGIFIPGISISFFHMYLKAVKNNSDKTKDIVKDEPKEKKKPIEDTEKGDKSIKKENKVITPNPVKSPLKAFKTPVNDVVGSVIESIVEGESLKTLNEVKKVVEDVVDDIADDIKEIKKEETKKEEPKKEEPKKEEPKKEEPKKEEPKKEEKPNESDVTEDEATVETNEDVEDKSEGNIVVGRLNNMNIDKKITKL